jgi:tetratricopeptide (TPR) repeat protein
MGSELDDREEQARLLAVIVESDAIVNECRGSDDPVAVRTVIDALVDKAFAFSDLERFEESLAVWNELLGQGIGLSGHHRLWMLGQKVWAVDRLDRFAAVVTTVDELFKLFDELERTDDGVLIAARALAVKVYALNRLGDRQREIQAGDELVSRFGEICAVSGRVAWALERKAAVLLGQPERLDEALAVSEQLRERLKLEPDETLAPVARAAANHVSDLGKMAPSVVSGTVVVAGLALAGVTVELIRSGHAVLSRVQPRIGAAVPIADGVDVVLAHFGPVDRRRRRLSQALAVNRTLIQRLGASDDPVVRQLTATAQLTESLALIGLGHVRDGYQAYERVVDCDTAGAADAFQSLADRLPTNDTNPVTQLSRMAVLGSRADALAKGDTAVARIAFDDSVKALPPEVRKTRVGQLAAWLMRPKGDSALTVPAYPPKTDSADT